MQVLDNAGHPDGRSGLSSAGACYGLYAPSQDATRPVGSWNDVRLVVSGAHVEHWMNGVKIVEYELGSPDWLSRLEVSPFETLRPTAASLAATSRSRTTAIVSPTAASRSEFCRNATDDTDTASITSDPHHFSSCVDGSLSRYHRGVTGTALARESIAGVSAAGTGFLQVVKRGGRSVVCRAFAASPLKLLTPRNHGAAAWVYAASYGGGLVGGDAIRLAVDVAPGAMAFLSTQSSTKAYRSDRGTSAHLDAIVGDAGLLVVAPDPVVCFAGSSYQQSQQFEENDYPFRLAAMAPM